MREGLVLLTTRESAQETAHGQNRDMHLLALDKKVLVLGAVIVLPQGFGVVANIAAEETQSVRGWKIRRGDD